MRTYESRLSHRRNWSHGDLVGAEILLPESSQTFSPISNALRHSSVAWSEVMEPEGSGSVVVVVVSGHVVVCLSSLAFPEAQAKWWVRRGYQHGQAVAGTPGQVRCSTPQVLPYPKESQKKGPGTPGLPPINCRPSLVRDIRVLDLTRSAYHYLEVPDLTLPWEAGTLNPRPSCAPKESCQLLLVAQ